MSDKWFPGSAEFSPTKLATAIRSGTRTNADPDDRATIRSLLDYHREYIRVTAKADAGLPTVVDHGAVCHWAREVATEAQFFLTAYGMACAINDDDDVEMAKEEWKKCDFDALWEKLAAAECRAYKPITA